MSEAQGAERKNIPAHWVLPSYSSVSNPKAKAIAKRTSRILLGDKCAMNELRLDLEMVWMLSRFTAQAVCTPSSGVRITSVGIPRMLVVSGATVADVRKDKAGSRVNIKTGRRLSGCLKVYQ